MITCKECVYEEKGFCKRYPPQVFPAQAQNQLTGQVEMQVVMLPVQAQADNWCGEFKEKDKKLASVN